MDLSKEQIPLNGCFQVADFPIREYRDWILRCNRHRVSQKNDDQILL